MLAIVSTHRVLPDGGDLFFREIQYAYEAIGEGGGSQGPPRAADIADLTDEIIGSGLVEQVEIRRYLWQS